MLHVRSERKLENIGTDWNRWVGGPLDGTFCVDENENKTERKGKNAIELLLKTDWEYILVAPPHNFTMTAENISMCLLGTLDPILSSKVVSIILDKQNSHQGEPIS